MFSIRIVPHSFASQPDTSGRDVAASPAVGASGLPLNTAIHQAAALMGEYGIHHEEITQIDGCPYSLFAF